MDSIKKSLKEYYEGQLRLNEIRIDHFKKLIQVNEDNVKKTDDFDHKKSLLINQIELEYLINKIEALSKTIQKI